MTDDPDQEEKRRRRALLILGALMAVELRGYIVKDGASPNRAVTLLRECCNRRGWNRNMAITQDAAESILKLVLDSIKRDGP